MKKQIWSGSAHVVIIVILVVVILGLLGFVLWSNYLKPKAETTQTATSSQQKTETTTPVANSRYDSQLYTFEYPREGWRVEEDTYELNGQSYTTPVAKTSDWAQAGMAINAGASVSVNTSTATQSLSEMKKGVANFSGGIAQDIKDMMVDGVNAFSYRMSYEGERYHTVFINNGTAYDIQYQYVYNTDASIYIDGYNMIVSTFRFK